MKRNMFFLVMFILAATACNLPTTGEAVSTIPPTVVPTDTPLTPPTTTPAGVAAPQCVSPAEATLPEQAPTYEALPQVVGDYLSAGGAVSELRAALSEWGFILQDTSLGEFGSLRASADITGDGRHDAMLTAIDPAETVTLRPQGTLFLYVCEDESYQLAYTHRPVEESEDGNAFPLSIPLLEAAEDLTGDSVPDVLYSYGTCGAHTCFENLQAVSWNGAEFVRLFDEPFNGPYPSFSTQDRDSDGKAGIIIDGGAIGSAGAGPQRTYRYVYEWNGSAMVQVEQTLTSEEHPIHLVNDADRLLAEGQYQEAIDLYTRSYTDQDLFRFEDSPYPLDELEAYARYKTIVAYAALGQNDQGLTAYDSLSGDFGAANTFVQYAQRFVETFRAEGDLSTACEAVVSRLPEDFSAQTPLNQFGYANTYYEPQDMCPL